VISACATPRVATGPGRCGDLSREAEILLDGGAYASESPFVTMKAMIHAAGPYRVPNVRVESTTVYTNKTYCGAFRGFGVPQVTFASESQMDELAAALGLDPLELRRRNALRPGEGTATGQVFTKSVGIGRTIERVAEKAGPRPMGPKPAEGLPAGRYLYGRGVACLLQGISNGAEGVDVVGASVQVAQDGSALVGVGLTELGQGFRTVSPGGRRRRWSVDHPDHRAQVDTDAVRLSPPWPPARPRSEDGRAEAAARWRLCAPWPA
jgi:CO/xanthine dehydrogenase Mo-binding subunit